MFYFINIIEMKIKVPMKCNFVTYQSAKDVLMKIFMIMRV